MCDPKYVIQISDRYLHYLCKLCKIKKISLEKRLMLYNGIFGCHGNICYVILINAFLQDTYYRSNLCVRSIGTHIDYFRKHAKIVCFI